LDIATKTWNDYKHRSDFLLVTTRAAEIIYNQKFAGASADLLNANIIARDLGLADKKVVEAKIQLAELSDEELTERLNNLESSDD